MELRQFRYFIAVAEELSFTKGAKRLNMAQPPVSRQIKSLEKEIGVQLFERRPGRVTLTDAGGRFLNAARVVLESTQTAIDVAHQAMNGEAGTIRVALGKGLGDVVSLVINQHIRTFPNIEIDVRDILSGLQTEALLGRKIDVGILYGPVTSPGLSSETVFREGLSVVLPRSSPLAKRHKIRLPLLGGETFLLIERGISPGVHDTTLALLRSHGLNPTLVPTAVTCYDEIGALTVASGKGIYLAPGKNPIHPSFAEQLISLPLQEPRAVLQIDLAWRKGESSTTILNFIKAAKTLLGPGKRVNVRKAHKHEGFQ